MNACIVQLAVCAMAAWSCASTAAETALPVGAAGPVGRGPSGKLLVMISKDLIKRTEAQLLVQTAVEACARLGTPASAMVLDANGAERAELSDDLTPLIGLITAGQKAQAVLAFKTSTSRLKERVETDKVFADQYAKDSRYFFVGGGVPIYKGGILVAVLAVGGTHTHDEACALDALKTLTWASSAAVAQGK
jgi:uncharacterized protein GlcG (DUF336 family)